MASSTASIGRAEGADQVLGSSLLGTTMRRAFVSGRLYLGYGAVMSLVLGLALVYKGGAGFTAAYPLILPIFGVVGSLGALGVFTSDRLKGVLEYLLAYGVSPRRLFVNVLVAGLAPVLLIVSVALVGTIGFAVARGVTIPATFEQELAVYSVPMAFASATFADTVGMYWTALSSPREGMASPTGLAPLIGVMPPVLTLAVIAAVGVSYGSVSNSEFLEITGVAFAIVALTVGTLLALAGKFLRRERLLSPS
ncbi:MAG TPA: hypothetical protein VGV89_00910 [Thermoplasmata archaeon]|nr:hypothetical protein [Thermoplasmata archaeon]